MHYLIIALGFAIYFGWQSIQNDKLEEKPVRVFKALGVGVASGCCFLLAIVIGQELRQLISN